MFKSYFEFNKFVKKMIHINVFHIIGLCVMNLIIAAIGGVIVPYISKYLFDNVITEKNFSILGPVAIFLIIITFMYLLIDVWYTYLNTRWFITIDFSLKQNYYKAMCNKNSSELKKMSAMDIFFRMFNDGQTITQFLSTSFISIPCSIIICIFMGIVMTKWSVPLTFYTTILIILNFICIVFLRKPITKINLQLKIINQNVAEYILEKLELILFGRIHGVNGWWKEQAQEQFEQARKITIKNTYIQKIINNIIEFLQQIWSIGFIVIGVYLMIKGSLSLGSFFAFQTIVSYFLKPFSNIITGIYSFQDAKVSYERYQEYYILEPVKEGRIIALEEFEKLEIKDLSFSYKMKEKNIFDHFSCEFNVETITAIVGENGSGKTTLLLLCAKLLVPNEGELLLDKVNLCDIDTSSYYRKIASFMMQDSVVFEDTFQNNLIMGGGYQESEIQDVIEMCNLKELIEKLPDKLNTRLGKKGIELSGGEKQKLNLARILLKKPRLIWLDEPTAAIDDVSRNNIISSLKIYKKREKAIIIINTHDIQLINQADSVVQL